MIKCTLQYILEIKSNVGFRGEGKTGEPGEKPLGAEWTTNKLSPHMTPSPGHIGGKRVLYHCAITAPPSIHIYSKKTASLSVDLFEIFCFEIST